MEIEFIVLTTAFGGRDIRALQQAIPGLKLCKDFQHNVMANFINSMRYTESPCIHLEDDIELCDGFYEKVRAAVKSNPDKVINFFSMRKEDYDIGKPHLVAGSRYLMNQCYYLPAHYGPMIAKFFESWERPKKEHLFGGTDTLISDFLKSRKEKYLQWFPHLVNHLEGKSLINPSRSSKRTDKYFTK